MTHLELTPEQAAEEKQITLDTVLRKVRAGEWPHNRYSQRQIRFTREQVEQIEQIVSVPAGRPAVPDLASEFRRVTRGARP